MKYPFKIGAIDHPLELLIAQQYPDAVGTDDFHNEAIAFGVRFGWGSLILTAFVAAYLFLQTFLFACEGSETSRPAMRFLIVAHAGLAPDSIGMSGMALALLLICALPFPASIQGNMK
jgi:hypothetical protein